VNGFTKGSPSREGKSTARTTRTKCPGVTLTGGIVMKDLIRVTVLKDLIGVTGLKDLMRLTGLKDHRATLVATFMCIRTKIADDLGSKLIEGAR
jgi:hypothetical protein